MLFLILMLTDSASGHTDIIYYVDVVEHNTVQRVGAPPSLRQVIFWRWKHYRDKNGIEQGRFDVVAWRMAEKVSVVRYDSKRRRYVAYWWEDGRIVTVYAVSYRVTITPYDVEVDQRTVLKSDRREGLLDKTWRER